MKRILYFFLGGLIFLNSCSPKITTSITKSYPSLDYRQDILVLDVETPFPDNYEQLGVVKIGDNGFSKNCDYPTVIEIAKTEARKVGGNVIKITEHLFPDIWSSSCHRITAVILKVDNTSNIKPTPQIDSSLINADYALIHVYRLNGPGFLVNYDLHLGDTVICTVKNNWKKTIKIRKDGLNSLWAKTETKVEIPINIKYGNEYYVRCGISMGALVGHPKIELVDNQTGKAEYQYIKFNKSDMPDKIEMNDGKEIECQIKNEDNEFIYITILNKGNSIDTKVKKSEIRNIQKGE
jgi:hypothetical protein